MKGDCDFAQKSLVKKLKKTSRRQHRKARKAFVEGVKLSNNAARAALEATALQKQGKRDVLLEQVEPRIRGIAHQKIIESRQHFERAAINLEQVAAITGNAVVQYCSRMSNSTALLSLKLISAK